jgi:hypothetical protein
MLSERSYRRDIDAQRIADDMFDKLEHNLGAYISDSVDIDSTCLEWGSINPSVRRKG